MVLVTVNCAFGTASVCHKYKVILCQDDTALNTFYLALDRGCHFFAIFDIKDHIGDFCIKLEINPCCLQISLHWQDQ